MKNVAKETEENHLVTLHPSLRWGTLEVICLIYSCRTSTGERAVTKRVNTSQINPLHSTAKRGQLSRITHLSLGRRLMKDGKVFRVLGENKVVLGYRAILAEFIITLGEIKNLDINLL